MLQTILLVKLRNIITSNICEFLKKFTYELYMNYDWIKHIKRERMYIGLHGYEPLLVREFRIYFT